MAEYVLPLQRLVEQFRKLPGIGGKTAVRMAFAVLNLPKEEVEEFAESMLAVKDSIHFCRRCFNFTESEICDVCADLERDASVICVVEDARAVMAFERVRTYRGTYHVLHGLISPMTGITPDALTVRELLTRLADGEVEEIIVATGATTEGEATAMYLSRLLSPLGVRVTRLAHGIPFGGALEYADEITLSRALEGRRDFN